MPKRGTVIAIDGPVASGKTVVGKKLAEQLGYTFVDTGAIYRAVTLAVLRSDVSLDAEDAIVGVAEGSSIDITSPTIQDGRLYTVLLDGQDATWAVRSPEVEAHVSQVSRIPGVRRALLGKQRALAARGRIVMVGRDVGTVVLPDADLKIFLVASPQVRARRRYEELRARGQNASQEGILQNLLERDRIDSQRIVAPLKPAEDAILVDTDHLSIDEVVAAILRELDGE
ncbi:MAG: (d)CMP kinase [Chloroflexota bacterium]|nr:MAG: (d)CMP kinase [Chloroflexota bacterium]